jgi:sugar diacid utilization regulator
MLDLVDEVGLQNQARSAVLKIGSRWTFTYVDEIARVVTREYTAERDRLMRSSIQRRVQLVRDVLAGAPIGSDELGYDLDAEHVAAVVKGASAEATLQEIAATLDRQLLTVAIGANVVWGWVGSQRAFSSAARRELATVIPPAGTRVALGEPAWGPDGFRSSHAEALAAHRVSERMPEPVIYYDHVALEAAMLNDERAARRLIERELWALNADDERSAKLRATLEAYLRTGHNASATAEMLAVNDRTVAYRIRTIEEAIGRSVLSRSAELAAALRLRRLFYETYTRNPEAPRGRSAPTRPREFVARLGSGVATANA